MAGKGGYRPGAGRPKAQHTIQAEKAKQELVRMFLDAKKPIFERLIKDAVAGDPQARKELFERVWGKVRENVDLNANLNHTFDDLPEDIYKAIIERERKRIKISSD